MLVDRRTFYIQAGHIEETVQLLLAEIKRVGHPTVRCYLSRTGRFNTLAVEHEFESLAAYENFWEAWSASPEGQAVLAKWEPLNEPGGTSELWTLLE